MFELRAAHSHSMLEQKACDAVRASLKGQMYGTSPCCAVYLVSTLALKGHVKSSEKLQFSKFSLWPMVSNGTSHHICKRTMPHRLGLKKTSLSNMKCGPLLKA